MKERGILFSPPMVRALLSGKKTQTRRLVNIDTLSVTLPGMVCADIPGGPVARSGRHRATMNQNGAVAVLMLDGTTLGVKPGEFDFVCPYADGVTRLYPDKKGWEIFPAGEQRLWVRETWARLALGRRFGVEIQYMSDGPPDGGPERYARSRFIDPCPDRDDKWRPLEWKKTPGMFMPRWASRIDLQITEIRLQRLQEISEEDALAEGIERRHDVFHPEIQSSIENPGRRGYAVLWDLINGKKAPWSENPWVWSIGFTRVTP